jgi:pimeloyl-ACP methyl ester carboxylesterase
MSWRPVMERLPAARMFAPDLRGYPGTDASPSGYHVFTLTDDVRALIEALGLERPLLVSHDWGGAIGMGAAVAAPGRFERFVLFNAAAFRSRRIPWRIRI